MMSQIKHLAEWAATPPTHLINTICCDIPSSNPHGCVATAITASIEGYRGRYLCDPPFLDMAVATLLRGPMRGCAGFRRPSAHFCYILMFMLFFYVVCLCCLFMLFVYAVCFVLRFVLLFVYVVCFLV